MGKVTWDRGRGGAFEWGGIRNVKCTRDGSCGGSAGTSTTLHACHWPQERHAHGKQPMTAKATWPDPKLKHPTHSSMTITLWAHRPSGIKPG